VRQGEVVTLTEELLATRLNETKERYVRKESSSDSTPPTQPDGTAAYSYGNAVMESIRSTGRWTLLPGGQSRLICPKNSQLRKFPTFFCNSTSPGAPKIYTAFHAKRFDAQRFADIMATQNILYVHP
jgi:hypothetical protein